MNLKKTICILAMVFGFLMMSYYALFGGVLLEEILRMRNWWWRPNSIAMYWALFAMYSVATLMGIAIMTLAAVYISTKKPKKSVFIPLFVVTSVALAAIMAGVVLSSILSSGSAGWGMAFIQIPYVGTMFVLVILGILHFCTMSKNEGCSTISIPCVSTPVSDEGSEVREKLNTLKSLHEQGALSEKEYKEYVKKVLG